MWTTNGSKYPLTFRSTNSPTIGVEICAVPTHVEVEQPGAVQTLAAAAHWTVRGYARKLAASATVGSAALVNYVQNQIK